MVLVRRRRAIASLILSTPIDKTNPVLYCAVTSYETKLHIVVHLLLATFQDEGERFDCYWSIFI
jgi:hypothetical protein